MRGISDSEATDDTGFRNNMNTLKFTKMHGLGNDFMVID
ncbi:diaminopimelate epimerase, partial [Salmonella enterica subsp. enterica]|nr:diaminopimelate epimerase [Salmonella enterica subsp. enterica]